MHGFATLQDLKYDALTFGPYVHLFATISQGLPLLVNSNYTWTQIKP
jgi:hypothetical protein